MVTKEISLYQINTIHFMIWDLNVNLSSFWVFSFLSWFFLFGRYDHMNLSYSMWLLTFVSSNLQYDYIIALFYIEIGRNFTPPKCYRPLIDYVKSFYYMLYN